MHIRIEGNTRRGRGFSLIELMIAVAIIGIIGAIVYPSYRDGVVRSSRSDAKTILTTTANSLERFFASNRTYTTDVAAIGLEEGFSPAGKYRVYVQPGPTGTIETSYVILAKPVIGKGQDQDADCPNYTLNSAAERTPDPQTTSCW